MGCKGSHPEKEKPNHPLPLPCCGHYEVTLRMCTVSTTLPQNFWNGLEPSHPVLDTSGVTLPPITRPLLMFDFICKQI